MVYPNGNLVFTQGLKVVLQFYPAPVHLDSQLLFKGSGDILARYGAKELPPLTGLCFQGDTLAPDFFG